MNISTFLPLFLSLSCAPLAWAAETADLQKAAELTRSAAVKAQRKDLDGAEQDLLQAMTYSEDDPRVRKNLGVVYFEKGALALKVSADYRQAQRYLKMALEIDPSSVRYSRGYATALFEEARAKARMGLNEEAMPLYLKAAERDPGNVHLWVEAGHFAWMTQKLTVAASCLEKAEALDPSAGQVQILKKKLSGSSAEAGYAVESSEHFIVAADQNYLWKTAEQNISSLEEVYDQVAYKLGEQPKNKITVVFYPIKEFHDRLKLPARVTGHFDGKLQIPYQSKKIPFDVFSPVLKHELTHAFLSQIAPAKIPRWLNEGLAQWVEEKKITPKSRDALVIYQISGRAPDITRLDQVLSAQANPYNGTEMTLAYMKSLSIVQYLIDRNGLWPLMNFVKEYGTLSDDQLFRKHFGQSVAEIQQGWLRWIEAAKL